jgi:hypothetical protein
MTEKEKTLAEVKIISCLNSEEVFTLTMAVANCILCRKKCTEYKNYRDYLKEKKENK